MTHEDYNDDFYRQKNADIYDDEIFTPDNNLSEIEECKNEDSNTFNNRGVTPVQNQVSTVEERQELFTTAPGSPTVLGIEYTQGYLRTIIGRRVRVTFLLGTSSLTDRSGILTHVGISYIILRQTQTNTDVLCDIYSIEFVNIFD